MSKGVGAAPAHLSPVEAVLWHEHAPSFELVEAPARGLLESAVTGLALAREAAAMIADEGLILEVNSGATWMPHPAVRIVREARQQYLRSVTELKRRYPRKDAGMLLKGERRKRGPESTRLKAVADRSEG